MNDHKKIDRRFDVPEEKKLYPPSSAFICVLTILVGWFLLACSLDGRSAAAVITTTAGLPSPSATPVPPTATPSPTLTLTPTPSPRPSPTYTPTLTPDPELALQKQAMLPDFAADVDQVAAAGASRYYLEVSLPAPDRLQGMLQVRYTNTEDVPLSEIYFRLYPNLSGYGGRMEVSQILVEEQMVAGELVAEDSGLAVPLAAPLLPGDSIDISLNYRAEIPANITAGYGIFARLDQTTVLAGFYPVIAVYDDEEGWNVDIPPPYGDATYLDVSLYQVQLTVPETMVVVASGSLIETRLHDNGTKTLFFVSGPMRDFYLAMREDFQRRSETVGQIVVNSYYPPDLADGGQLALSYAVESLRIFERLFGPYPYAEFDVVASPTRAGGIEYPGVVVLSQHIYNRPGGFFQHAAAHEVAHQWWYGLVGNDQVDDPWLDESLTNYSAILYWTEVEGPEMAQEIIQNYFQAPYQRARAQDQDRAVIGPVESFTESNYSTIVYGKGPLFFHALRQQVGDETYFQIMQRYYTAYKYKIARPEDLLAIIEEVSGQDITPLFETWME